METKNALWKSSIKDLTEKGRVLISVNAIGLEDEDGDISEPGSFKKTLKEHFKRTKWFLNHDRTILLGAPIQGKELGKQLEMEGQLNMEKQVSRDTYYDYKLYAEHGLSLEHSIGVNAVKFEIDNDKQVRRVFEWKLWEFSTLTHWGASYDPDNANQLIAIKDSENAKKLLSEMSNNSKYSDTRKQNIENDLVTLIKNSNSLLIEPSRQTLDQKAELKDLFNVINNSKNLNF